jgi:hypothetical protein
MGACIQHLPPASEAHRFCARRPDRSTRMGVESVAENILRRPTAVYNDAPMYSTDSQSVEWLDKADNDGIRLL